MSVLFDDLEDDEEYASQRKKGKSRQTGAIDIQRQMLIASDKSIVASSIISLSMASSNFISGHQIEEETKAIDEDMIEGIPNSEVLIVDSDSF